ncbi:MAG: histidinol-phosphate transaminase [Gammaproteobacteria bacterium]|nr:histidinol-phosphate transaminase [Gammaproteobacteria bacterium]
MSGSLNDLVQHWIRPEIATLSAYHVQSAGGMIKLDAMENPYTWPAELRDAWTEVLRATDVNRYPDPQARRLSERLAETMAVPEGMRVLLGNGSDELIQMIALALAGPSRCVLSVDPGFVMYRMIATFAGLRYVGVPLRAEDFGLDLPAVLQAMEEHQPAVVFIAYPNNPTGNLFDAEAVHEVIRAAPGLVVVDEAYAPFTDASFMSSLGEYDNLLVMRTVSKMGLAGLRLGMLAGPAAWLDEFDKVRLPYNINVLTQVSAEFALRHHAVFDAQTELVRSERERVSAVLAELPGVRLYPSQANFLLMRTPHGQAAAWFEGLRARGVLIKNLNGAHPMLGDCLRPTVGTPQENDALLAGLRTLAGAVD